jgi:hypothetical protein
MINTTTVFEKLGQAMRLLSDAWWVNAVGA